MPSQKDIDTQKILLTTYRQTLDILLEQQALLGPAYAPPGIVNGIRIARNEIQRIKGILRGWNIPVEDLPNDTLQEDQKNGPKEQFVPHSDESIMQRNVFTGGGDYAEGNIDSRQGVFLDNNVTHDPVIVGINQGTINTSVQFDMQSLVSAQEELFHRLEQLLPRLLPQIAQTQLPQISTVTTLPSVDSAPLAPELYVQRELLSQQFEHMLSSCTWLALVDSSGKGKTQLARDIVKRDPTLHTWWVSLRDRDPAILRLHLEQQFARWLMQLTCDSNVWVLYTEGYLRLSDLAERIAQVVGASGIVVVDNLPDPVDFQLLYDDLCLITSTFAIHNVKLVTTSQRRLPPSIELQIGQKISVTSVMSFTSMEVLNLLEQAKAPEYIRQEIIVSLILADTKGLPLLVGAYALWLKQRHWQLHEEGLTALITGTPGESVREFARRQILQLLEYQSREVLYRLSLIQFEFDKSLAAKIAAVEPVIERIGEFIDELAGPWLDRKQDAKYEISPLLKESGLHALDVELQRNIHRAIVNHLLTERVIDVSQAHKLILHLSRSHDHDRLVVILAQILMAAHTEAQAKQVMWMTHIMTKSRSWPDEMGLNLRIILRSAQVHARVVAGEDATDLDSELEALMAEAGSEHAAAVFFACLATGPMLEGLSPLVNLQRTIRALRVQRKHHLVPDNVLPNTIDEVIVFPLVHIKNPEQLRLVLEELRDMTEVERRNLFATDLALEMIPALIDRTTWSYEVDKPPSERQWDKVLTLLDEVKDIGNLPGAELLLMAHARARAVIFADYLGKPDIAIAELEGTLPQSRGPLIFLLHYTAGCILFDVKRSVEALTWFDTAPAIDHDIFMYYNFDAKRRRSILRGQLGQWELARRHCIEAIQTSAFHAGYYDYDRLEMFGELAWIHWSTGNRQKACAALYGFIFQLIAQGDETNTRFREVYNKVVHSLGWLLPMATLGEAPSSTLHGGDYTSVHPGLYALRRPAMSEHTLPFGFSKIHILALLGVFSSRLGLYRMAMRVYQSALTYAQNDDQYWLLGIGDIDFAGLTARFGLPEDALSAGLRATKIFGAAQRLFLDNALVPPTQIDSERSWKALSIEERQREERRLLYIVFGPVFAEIISEKRLDTEVSARIAAWEQALINNQPILEEPAYWQNVISYLRLLTSILMGAKPAEQELALYKDEPLLQAMGYLAVSTQVNISLKDALQLQVYALNHLMQNIIFFTHMFPGVGRFIHQFWLDVVNRQSFALRSPQLFRSDLLRISPSQGLATATRTLQLAARAIGVALPETFLAKSRKAK